MRFSEVIGLMLYWSKVPPVHESLAGLVQGLSQGLSGEASAKPSTANETQMFVDSVKAARGR